MRRGSVALFRAIRLGCHLVYGALLATTYPRFPQTIRQSILKRWSDELLKILHVRLEIAGHGQTLVGTMLIANHVSWLDVFAINTISPSCFIAKSEVRDWPLLGMLCRQARTVFIDRNLRRDTLHINRQISELIANGECVALFPEGTSTDGSQIRHFHSSLFQSAIDCEAAIQPVAIRYHDGSGKPCNDAAFIDDMSFIRSLINILLSRSLHATLVLLPALSCAGENRRTLASKAQTAIGAALQEQSDRPYSSPPAALSPIPSTTTAQSAYSLLLDPIFKLRKRYPG